MMVRAMDLTPAQVIVFATPVFLGLIALEFGIGWARGRRDYRWADAMNSIGLGMLSQLVGLFTRVFNLGIYTWVYQHAALFELSAQSLWVWLFALLGYDFCYYWLHRGGHRVALLWAAHSVHHQSEDFNLSTALRQTSSGFLFGWIFYLPLALLGVPPLVFGVVALIDLLYQFWVHTELVGKLGWFDRWFCSPSNHRVHHAVNPQYLDKNYGGILIIWDRLFGTFAEEQERCVYGTVKPLRSWDPLWANGIGYVEIAKAWRAARGWGGRLAALLAPPGWQPGGALPQVDLQRPRFDPPLAGARLALALLLFVGAMAATLALLWWAAGLAPLPLAAASAAVVGLLWACGRACQPDSAQPELAVVPVPQQQQRAD
ncbi:sterol desaturase family protein [Inhella sp.]|uniref:sterol desaturase family protein n=1 Tax=Inhella sp. TaxID=1921806 RepID=UPI0035B1B5C6